MSPATSTTPPSDAELEAALSTALAAADPAELHSLTISPGLPVAVVARTCGVSRSTVTNITRMFRARLAAAILQDPTAPPHLITLARHFTSRL